MISKTGWL